MVYVPYMAVGEVAQQFLIGFRAHVTSPDDLGVVDIGPVVDPFLAGYVARAVVDEDEVLAGQTADLRLQSLAVDFSWQRGAVAVGKTSKE